MMKDHTANLTELEALSAYLDGQLPGEEAALIQTRLEADAVFRAQLDALRQTRYTLRNTPKIKRPRSFVLSPEMVRRQKTAVLGMNFSRIISAAASVLLIVVLGGQFLLAGGGMNAASQAYDAANDSAAEPDVAMLDAPAEAMEMEAPMAGAPMDAGDAAGEAAEDAADAEPAEESAPPATEAGESAAVMDDDAQEKTAAGVSELTPAPTMTNEERADPTLREAPEGQTPDAPTEGPEATLQDIPGELEPVLAEPHPAPGFSLSMNGLIQAGLLILAVGGGILAAYFRKRVR